MKFKFKVYTQPDEKGRSKLVSTDIYDNEKDALKAQKALRRLQKGIRIVESDLPEFGKRMTLQQYGGYKVTKIEQVEE